MKFFDENYLESTKNVLNYVIDLAIANSSITNLITICFIFVLFYFVNDILTYVSNLSNESLNDHHIKFFIEKVYKFFFVLCLILFHQICISFLAMYQRDQADIHQNIQHQ